jgi:muramidase (phage lysozyme)
MTRGAAIAVLLGFGALLLYAGRAAAGTMVSPDAVPWLPPGDPSAAAPDESMVTNANATAAQRVAAFLAMIRQFESSGQYNVLYGGQTFSDFSAHPDVKVPFFNPKTQKQDYSTAAGAYQINYPTWSTVVQPGTGLVAFDPASQDAAAVYLLQVDGAYDSIVAGDIDTALQIASKRWASLPYSSAQQNPVSVASAMDAFSNFLADV